MDWGISVAEYSGSSACEGVNYTQLTHDGVQYLSPSCVEFLPKGFLTARVNKKKKRKLICVALWEGNTNHLAILVPLCGRFFYVAPRNSVGTGCGLFTA
jgi:hypothetical protein